jgi:hypothetical protein
VLLLICGSLGSLGETLSAAEPRVRQLTTGPKHHFFGYIGHARTVPWNESGRFILGLRSAFQDRMPTAVDAADVILLDTQNDYAVVPVDQTRGWNFQQGTMFYWNPRAPETEFFFNDRDNATGEVFTVLFDISAEQSRRKREFRFPGRSIGNGGVAPAGGRFAAINYGRMARLRLVTGYPEAADWTDGVLHPTDDGVFVVDVETGQERLLVSFQQLADEIRPLRPDIDDIALFINHTLWSPDGMRLFFFCRGDFDNTRKRVDIPFVINADGSGLTRLVHHFGGHPEWLDGHRMIGKWDEKQGIYEVDAQRFVGSIGDETTFDNPEGDIALSPDGRWFVNGRSRSNGENHYTFYRMADGLTLKGGPLSRGKWTSGPLRIDGGPAWNRQATAVLVTAVASDAGRTRQMFLIELPESARNTNPDKPATSARPTGASSLCRARVQCIPPRPAERTASFVNGMVLEFLKGEGGLLKDAR